MSHPDEVEEPGDPGGDQSRGQPRRDPADLVDPGSDGRTRDRRVDPSWSWYFLRVSGVLLALLAPVHFVDRFLAHDAEAVDGAFLVGRWSHGGWLLLEWAFVLLAVLHGGLGLHRLVQRSIGRLTVQLVVEGMALGLTGSLFLYTTWVIFTLP